MKNAAFASHIVDQKTLDDMNDDEFNEIARWAIPVAKTEAKSFAAPRWLAFLAGLWPEPGYEWVPVHNYRILDIDGEKVPAHEAMRRWNGSAWEYRKKTADEIREDLESDAW
jgi:hypothetical protein